MEVRTKQGTINKSLDIHRGLPGNEMTREEHLEKFQDCASYAAKPLPPENVAELVSTVDKLEEVGDISSLIPLLLS